MIDINPQAKAILTEAQRKTLETLENGSNTLEVFTASELPDSYVAFLLWYGGEKNGNPIYGGIDAAGLAST